MPFADTYLKKQSRFPESIILQNPSARFNMAVVIPCYNEPAVQETLIHLSQCDQPNAAVEVYIVFNAPEDAPKQHREQNIESFNRINAWREKQQTEQIRFFPIHLDTIPKKKAGVGFARKVGMDEAIRRFNRLNHANGIIISLDADCVCEANYLKEIEKRFRQKPGLNGLNINVEHDVSRREQLVVHATATYELYLRYYVEMLRRIKFPYAFHTIGSGFAVKASAYVKQGGMNSRQGGEDFYFLQKLFALGDFEELNSTKVVPASRLSERVPFGTGPEIVKILNNNGVHKAYHPDAFNEVAVLISHLNRLHKSNENAGFLLNELPPTLSEFLHTASFNIKIQEIRKHTADYSSFRKRFFQWFNAFMIVKFLNYAHTNAYSRVNLLEIISEIFPKHNKYDVYDWLEFMRSRQTNSEFSIPQ